MAKGSSSVLHGNRNAPKEYFEEVLQIDRVTRVVSGGRRLRFRVTLVMGNKKGKIGMGVGKAGEVIVAIQKATQQAKKNMINVKITNDTITHSLKHKFKSARIMLMPAGEGTGIIAGGAVRKVVELAGIKNILSKSFGTSNKISVARATLQALATISQADVRETPEKKKNEAAPVTTEAKKPVAKSPAPKKAE